MYDKNAVDSRAVADPGKYRSKFDLPDGTEQESNVLPSIILRHAWDWTVVGPPRPSKSVTDNGTYLNANFDDSVISSVPSYEIERPKTK